MWELIRAMVRRKEILCVLLVLSLMINPFVVITSVGATTQALTAESGLSEQPNSENNPFDIRILYDSKDFISIKNAKRLQS